MCIIPAKTIQMSDPGKQQQQQQQQQNLQKAKSTFY